ncbi:hypothetical protein FEE95_19810 [Maribacter algarum]|uniref:Malectin domain-containing protein n=1 Tax=Maribacter algarum (ex Zhang et al. 2020) TaxID=2578118 RepID=A0A5S3PGR6_9FLAO|nr:hypothetical protein FEE95_19810 [Maribacter algarum]
MKRIVFSKMKLIVLLFSLAIISSSCGSDDPDPPAPVVDTDGDGVADADDACPSEAGLAALGGCPDADSDGVADKDDSCPNEAGLSDLAGCPDADGDGIADKDDACPNEAGVAALDGCPEDAMESTDVVGPNILKINCGGPEVTIGAETFLEDQYTSTPSADYTAHPSITEIANTDLDEIYLTETITSNEQNNGPVSYDIPVSNGTYTVKLHFAEIYWGETKTDGNETLGGIGSRIFDVDIENTSILNTFDVFEVAGGSAIAFTKMYDIEVTDGELNIVFTSTVDKPKVSAIEIFGDGTINP